jgi:phosphotransferase system  glucose/maltose/N-acetylglucosamine-specific IIC component
MQASSLRNVAMKKRLIIFLLLVTLAFVSLGIAVLWGVRMKNGGDAAKIDQANYFVHTWMVTFVILAGGAVAVLLNMIFYWMRRDSYDGDGINE